MQVFNQEIVSMEDELQEIGKEMKDLREIIEAGEKAKKKYMELHVKHRQLMRQIQVFSMRLKKAKKRVLWFSRHNPTMVQLRDLEDKIGDFDYVQVSKTVENADEVLDIFEETESDAMVVVLPLPILADLVKKAPVKPIRAVMNRKINFDGSVTFEHDHFERVLDIKVETEKL